VFGNGHGNAKWGRIKTNRLKLRISGGIAVFKHLWDGSEKKWLLPLYPLIWLVGKLLLARWLFLHAPLAPQGRMSLPAGFLGDSLGNSLTGRASPRGATPRLQDGLGFL